MIALAEAEFRLSRRAPDGRTEREHLEVAARLSVSARRQLDEVAELLSDETVAIPWSWFMELAMTRTSNGFGPNPISLSEIESWERRVGLRLRSPELGWMLALDRLFLGQVAEDAAARSKKRH